MYTIWTGHCVLITYLKGEKGRINPELNVLPIQFESDRST